MALCFNKSFEFDGGSAKGVPLGWNSHGCSWMQDDSRTVAMALFPELEPLLKRKKDHGIEIPSPMLS